MQLDVSPEQSDRIWAELPRHFWGVIGMAKPGAVVLASFLDEDAWTNKQVKQTEEERLRNQAIIVRQNYGFGRVLFIGLDSTWRWRYKVGDTYHHRFWGQVIRWAASDKPLVVGNENVRFGTREPVFPEGQDVDVVVRLEEHVARGLPERVEIGARILRQLPDGKGEETRALVPLAGPARQRILEGRVRDLPAGAYAVELVVPDPVLSGRLLGPAANADPKFRLRAPFTVTPQNSDETVQLETNWTLLEELAQKSGGRVFTAEDASELIDWLTRQSVTRVERTERKLWQSWLTLWVFLVLLCAEWVGRKLAGLP